MNLKLREKKLSDKEQILFEDTPSYDRTLIAVAVAMPIVIMGPVFFLLAYSEPALSQVAFMLFILVPVIILVFPFALAVPTSVMVSRSGVSVKHGLFLRIRVPSSRIISSEIKPPPWWFNLYYLYPNAQWVHIRKSHGLLKWWYIPTKSARRLVVALEEIRE